MCTAAITLTTKGLANIDNAEILLKIKSVFALFIQTMEVSFYPVKKKREKKKKVSLYSDECSPVSRAGDTLYLLLTISSCSSLTNTPSC